MKQTGQRWISCLLGMLLAALLLGTTAFAGSADGALGSFVQDKLNELLEEELAPNVPDQAQGMMDSLTQEKEDGGLFSLLSMTPSELLAAIKDAALQQVSGPLEVLGRLLAVALLCAVLSAVRQSAVSARLQGIFLVVATACILSFLGEPVFACIDQTVQALRQNGGFEAVVFLDCSFETCYQRIKDSDRPLVRANSREGLEQIFLQRQQRYREVADLIVPNESLVSLTVEQILRELPIL